MKVLHVCFSNSGGGAAKAAYRLHQGMLAEGIESHLLVAQKQGDDPTVIGPKSKFRRLFYLFVVTVSRLIVNLQKSRNPIYHSVNTSPTFFHNIINQFDVDIVNLHWVNDEMISVAEIGKIKKPIVWTLHDSWAFCGAEHHAAIGDVRYIEGYLPKNRPSEYRGLDIDRWTWERKLKHWRLQRFIIIAPSRWLAEQASLSQLFKHRKVKTIPNGINLCTFSSFPKKIARERFGIPASKRIILIGSMGAMSDPNKGYDLMQDALSRLSKNYQDDVEIVVFGGLKQPDTEENSLRTHYLGYLGDEVSLALVYSLADVYVVPSRIENLPNTIVEAFACSCPVVAFGVGGISDIIDHKENGYIANAYSTQDLAQGIEWVLSDDDRLVHLGVGARDKATSCFDVKKVVSQYLQLYQHTIE
jgi:glycosyltransferase involved in cell wall biosynthesis